MRRWHLFELGDQAWCPALLRDLVTDFLQTMLVDLRLYDGAAPRWKVGRIRSPGSKAPITYLVGLPADPSG